MTVEQFDRQGLPPIFCLMQAGSITAAFSTEEAALAYLNGLPDHSACDHLEGGCVA